jgi:16S rRNA (guanine1516-N2)-methyltransferase
MPIPLSKLVVISGSESCDLSYLESIAALVCSPIISWQEMPHLADVGSFKYLLYLNDHALELRSLQNKQQKALSIDFLEGKARHRRIYGGGKGQDIAKAIGIRKIPNARVIDATAGLGRDAFVLASLGCSVTLLERNPVIYSLLNDALERVNLSNDPQVKAICSRMMLVNENATDYLLSQKKADYADVIYLDPMFPERKKSAKVKKEMSYFHDIVGEDHDSDALLHLSCKQARKRIVVKRPRLATALAGLKANFNIKGKSTRYDIYLPKT